MSALSLLIITAAAHGTKTYNKANSQKTMPIYKDINWDYVKRVKPIFKRTCFDCHGDTTKYPWYYKLPLVKQLIDHDIKEAKEHLDFSNDFPFKSHDSPLKDLKEIEEVMEKKEMPPFLYKIMHANSQLKKEDIAIIKNWLKKSIKSLQAVQKAR